MQPARPTGAAATPVSTTAAVNYEILPGAARRSSRWNVSVKAAGGRSVTVNVTIQGNVIGNREYTEQVGAYVGRKVLAALGNT